MINLKRIFKILAVIAILLIIDASCSKRDIKRMPPVTTERIASLFNVYKPSVFKASYNQLVETSELYFTENAKEGGIRALQKVAAYIHGFSNISTQARISLAIPLCILLFFMAILSFSRILGKRLEITLDDTTSTGNVFK